MKHKIQNLHDLLNLYIYIYIYMYIYIYVYSVLFWRALHLLYLVLRLHYLSDVPSQVSI